MKQRSLLAAALVSALFLAACSSPWGEIPVEKGPVSGMAGETGWVRIQLGSPGRTALPVTMGAISEYKLEFFPGAETGEFKSETITGTTKTVDLIEGSYTLIVSGLDASGNCLAEGSEEFSITAEGETEVTVNLALVQKGEGTLSYRVNLPGGLTLTQGSLRFSSLSGGGEPEPVYLDGSSLSGTVPLASGYYLVKLDLFGTVSGTPVSFEKALIAHIYDYLETPVDYTVEETDFRDNLTYYEAGTSAEFNTALTAIQSGAGTEAMIFITGSFSSPPVSLANAAYNGKTITIRSKGSAVRTITLSGSGSLFTIGSSTVAPTLILQDLTLKGISSNSSSLVRVSGGTFVLDSGATISGNTSARGGGVYVESGGTFTMSGGTISGNTASSSYGGGGVYVESGGTFTMNGGAISGNTASSGGGGVLVDGGTFTMSGGTISGNTSSSSAGGGVLVVGGTFTMSGGAISGNTASSGGGGVSVGGGTFTMSGGAISGNTASIVSGGGVSVGGGTFTMSGGAISGNTASSSGGGGGGVSVNGGTFTMSGGAISGNTSARGGGVVVSGGTFTMSGGAISGNTATASSNSYGGGVYVYSNGTFTKAPVSGTTSSGIIYGSEETGTDEAGNPLKNTANNGSSGCGSAVYYSSAKYRDTTVGEAVSLSTGSSANWTDPSVSIQNISYSSVSGGTWTLQGDGRYKSPTTANSATTKERVSFTSTAANALIVIQLDVSSESGCDFAFISTLDNASATLSSGYYTGSKISGTNSVTITIPVPTVGSHFVEIGYGKDGSDTVGSDCAWFKVIE
ncbi:hypothetical protein AGMMS49928_18460 [Spirochaetia bacterium]|nr:hypothetical protein AGMMS49928_18460 [Spirochaetia bacterium]